MKMRVNRWDFEKHEYDIIEVPDNWIITTRGSSQCNCVSCGRKVYVDDCYTSYQYQDAIGFGYLVCEDCYNKEWELRKRCKDESNN